MPRSRFSRRRVLASLGAAPMASALSEEAASLPVHAETPPAVKTQRVFSAVLRVRLATPADATVGSAIILGGDADGELRGVVQPGSLEWTRDPTRDVLQLAARFELQAGDSLRVHVADRAMVVGARGWDAPFPTTPELSVVDGPAARCREGVYLGRMDASQMRAGLLRVAVDRVL